MKKTLLSCLCAAGTAITALAGPQEIYVTLLENREMAHQKKIQTEIYNGAGENIGTEVTWNGLKEK